MPLLFGALFIAIPAAMVRQQFVKEGLWLGLGVSLIGLPFVMGGVMIIVGGYRAKIRAARGLLPALKAKFPDAETVTVCSGFRGFKDATLSVGDRVEVTEILGQGKGSSVRGRFKVMLTPAADPTTHVPFLYQAEFDEAAYERLRDGLRAHGLKASKLFSELPPVRLAEDTASGTRQ